jgi:hypothetical protein
MPESTVTDTLGKAQAFCRMAPVGGQSGMDNEVTVVAGGGFLYLEHADNQVIVGSVIENLV